MKNYVLIDNISNEQSASDLIIQLKKKFPRNKDITESNFKYFAFAERELPGVQDTLQEIMDSLSLVEPDYIALYYTREEEPDEINRLMIFGTSSHIDSDFKKKKTSQTIQERILAELLEFSFIKAN